MRVRGALACAAVAVAGIVTAACTLAYHVDDYTGGPLDDAGAHDSATDALEAASSDAGSAYRARVLEDRPLAYWRLGERGGTSTAVDETGSHPGQYLSVTLGVRGAVAGDPDTAAHFDQAKSGVVVGAGLDLAGGTSFSIEAWVKPDLEDDTLRRVVTKRLDTPTEAGVDIEGFSLLHSKAKGFLFEAYHHSTFQGTVSDAGPPVGTYTYVVVTYDGSFARIYVDGVEVARTPTTIDMSVTTADLVLGSLSSANGNTWHGDLDEMAIYDHALSLDRITSHRAAALAR